MVTLGGVQSRNVVRFGPFEANLSTGELRKYGAQVRLGGQPTQILWALLEKRGEIVTREELRRKLWADDTFVEFDNGLNNALKKLRSALGDSAGEPLYIETLPRVGYRFVAPVERAQQANENAVRASHDIWRDSRSSQETGKRSWKWTGFAVAAGLAVSAYGLLSSPPEPRAVSFVQNPISEHVDGFGRIVTDGVRVFFLERSGDHDTLVQTSAAGGPVSPAETPFRNTRIFDISPDRSEFLIGNFEARKPGLPLWIWPVQGGSPIRVGGVIADDASWAPDARRILYARGSDIHIVGRDGNGDRVLIHTNGIPYWIQFSPDSSKMSYTVDSEQSDARAIWEANSDGSNPRVRFPGWTEPPGECCADWTPDGKYVVFSSRHAGFENLWAIRTSASWFHWRAPVPVQLTPTARALTGSALITTRSGIRAFVTARNEVSHYERYDVASQGFQPFPTMEGAIGTYPSPDGTKTLVLKNDWTLWRTKADGSAALQLTEAPLEVSQPRWSPDGSAIAFEAHIQGRPVRAYVMSSEGGPTREILALEGEQSVPAWSPDGSQIAIAMNVEAPGGGGAARGIYLVDLKTQRSVKLENSEGLTAAMWSPNGKYFVAKTTDERTIELFDAAARKWKTIADGTIFSGLTWSRDSKYLYVQKFVEEGQPIYRLHAGDFRGERVIGFETALRQGAETCVLQSGAADGSLIVRMRNSGGQVYALDLSLP